MEDLRNVSNNSGYHSAKLELVHWRLTIFVLVLCYLGLLGNLIIFITIFVNKKLHSPSYISIACLAVAESVCLVMALVDQHISMAHLSVSNLYVYLYSVLFDTAHNSSILHLLLFTFVRYALIVHPLQSRSYMTSKLIICMSVVCWSYSLIFSVSHFVILYFKIKSQKKISKIVIAELVFVTVLNIVPMALMLIFHALKLRRLKQSRVSQKFAQRMSHVLACIIFVHVLKTAFYIIFYIDIYHYFIYTNYKGLIMDRRSMRLCLWIILALNYACNPICFLFSPPCKQFVSKLMFCFSKLKCRHTQQSIDITIHECPSLTTVSGQKSIDMTIHECSSVNTASGQQSIDMTIHECPSVTTVSGHQSVYVKNHECPSVNTVSGKQSIDMTIH